MLFHLVLDIVVHHLCASEALPHQEESEILAAQEVVLPVARLPQRGLLSGRPVARPPQRLVEAPHGATVQRRQAVLLAPMEEPHRLPVELHGKGPLAFLEFPTALCADARQWVRQVW